MLQQPGDEHQKPYVNSDSLNCLTQESDPHPIPTPSEDQCRISSGEGLCLRQTNLRVSSSKPFLDSHSGMEETVCGNQQRPNMKLQGDYGDISHLHGSTTGTAHSSRQDSWWQIRLTFSGWFEQNRNSLTSSSGSLTKGQRTRSQCCLTVTTVQHHQKYQWKHLAAHRTLESLESSLLLPWKMVYRLPPSPEWVPESLLLS